MLIPNQIFIQKAKRIHGNKYDYSLVNYVKAIEKVDIICPVHGIFQQTPNTHLSKSGCPKCYSDKRKNIFNDSKEDFIKKSQKRHGCLYDYSNVKYVNARTKVIIICPFHGEFNMTPDNHIRGNQKCPSCNISKGELIVEKYLIDKGIKFIKQKRFGDCRGIRNPLSFDFYLIEHNTCIEVDGIQHFKPIKWLGLAQSSFDKIKENDNIKNEYCIKNNIRLIRIDYSDARHPNIIEQLERSL